jgi:hypothetical protein
MAIKTINLGLPDKGNGDPLRTAFGKINDNFAELYAKDASDVNLSAINSSLIPDTNLAYDLGSETNRFRDLYLSGSTIDLGGTTLSVVGGELQIGGTSLTETITAGLASQGGLTSTLTVGEDSQTGGLLYDSGGAQLISIQNPEGNFNTLTARATIAGGQVILEAREEINSDPQTTALGQLTLNTGTFAVGVTTGLPGAGKEMIFTPDSLYLPVRIEHETDSNFVIRTSDYNAGNPIVNDFTFGIDGSLTSTTFNGTLKGNVDKIDAFTVSAKQIGVDQTPIMWSFVNTYGSGQTLSIPRADWPFVLSETYGWNSTQVNGVGILDGVLLDDVIIDETGDPITVTANINNGSFIEGETYTLTLTEAIVVSSSTLSLSTDGILSVDDGYGRVVTTHVDTNYLCFDQSVQIGGGGTGNRLLLAHSMVAILSTAPESSIGSVDDLLGQVAFDGTYMYYCTAPYDGVTNIWKRITWSGDTW